MAAMKVTFFADHAARSLSTQDMTLEQLRDLILKTTAGEKAQLPWLKLATFGDERTKNQSLRHNANVLEITGIEVDYDDKVMAFEEAVRIVQQAQLRALLYTSPSHKPDEPKWRILLPTSSASPPKERAKLLARINGLFGGILAGESFTLSQAYYYGSVNHNAAISASSSRASVSTCAATSMLARSVKGNSAGPTAMTPTLPLTLAKLLLKEEARRLIPTMSAASKTKRLSKASAAGARITARWCRLPPGIWAGVRQARRPQRFCKD